MREINIEKIIPVIKQMCVESNCIIPDEVENSLKKSLTKEKSSLGKEIIKQILENNKIAKTEKIPICQDTGIACVFIELGQEVQIAGGNFYEAINEGVRRGYKDGYLRKSVVKDPLDRKNTQDNTPAVIHTDIVPGDKLKITLLPKGAGAENMSSLAMFNPNVDNERIKRFVIDTIKKAGANPCPPIIVGIGIGGTFDSVGLLAKKALLRPVGSVHPDPDYARLEKELSTEINNTGIGPQGLGGKITALAVHIESYPCHIASLPVAVNINCHAARIKSATL